MAEGPNDDLRGVFGDPDRSSQAKLDIVSVVLRSVSILGRNFIPFFLISLISIIPVIAFDLLVPQGETFLELTLSVLPSAAIDLAMTYAAMALIVYGTLRDLQGRKASGVECIVRGAVAGFPAMLVVLICAAGILVASLALVIPGIAVGLIWWVAVPAAVAERQGIVTSLKRSYALTYENWLRLFGLFVFLVVFGVGLFLLVDAVIGIPASGTNVTLESILGIGFIYAISNALGGVVATVSYHDLRIAKEDVNSDDIAKELG